MTHGWAGQEVTTIRCPPHPEDHSTQPLLPPPSDIAMGWSPLLSREPLHGDPLVTGVGWGDALLLPQPGPSSDLTSL